MMPAMQMQQPQRQALGVIQGNRPAPPLMQAPIKPGTSMVVNAGYHMRPAPQAQAAPGVAHRRLRDYCAGARVLLAQQQAKRLVRGAQQLQRAAVGAHAAGGREIGWGSVERPANLLRPQALRSNPSTSPLPSKQAPIKPSTSPIRPPMTFQKPSKTSQKPL